MDLDGEYRYQVRRKMEEIMARRAVTRMRRAWTLQDERQLKRYSKSKTPVVEIAKALKRTPGALRQKALQLGIPLGHRR